MSAPVKRVVKGGSKLRFTENKTVLSQFTKNKDIMKITVHGELNIYFSFHGKYVCFVPAKGLIRDLSANSSNIAFEVPLASK